MVRRSAGLVVGREGELSVLLHVLDEHGPRVCFVYGIAGIGKSSLLARFADECAERGVEVFHVDCRSIEPTEASFLDGLQAAISPLANAGSPAALQPLPEAAVVVIDTYELFRISDPWLRHELLPRLGPSVRIVVAGREPPMLEWAVERGELGGLEVLPLGPLDDESVTTIMRAAGLAAGPAATEIARVSRGHPLALRLALEARLAADKTSDGQAIPRVVEALAGAFRAGLDEPTRRALDAAAVPRRITRGVLTAMLGDEGDAALDTLSGLAFVEPTVDGFALHDAVQSAVVERLRSVDPDRFRQYRTAAWHHLQTASMRAGRHELARSTADLLFLIDNPVVREAMFPTTAHLHSVEPSRPDDADDVRAIWHQHEPPEAAAVLDRWLERAPNVVRAIRDRSGTLVGASILGEWREIPPSLERDDPVLAAWASHAARHPLPPGQTTLVLRRVLARDGGEGPSSGQAAAWLDCKREYLQQRPKLGRIYFVLADPTPFMDALSALGITGFGEPVRLGGQAYQLLMLDFGMESVDGWLSRVAAAELGIDDESFLDPEDRTVDLGEHRVQLSPLEFGVLTTLCERRGRPVSRAELIQNVWGTNYAGGSNVVDVVIRSLRTKLGASAGRVETTRGVGYRFK
jgi:hypothetical protein